MIELLTGVTQWRLLIVGLLMAGLALGLRRTDLDPSVRRRVWLAVSLPLLLWMGVVWQIALAGLFVPGRGVPGIPLAVLLPLLVGLPLLLRSATLAAVLDAVEPSWLVGFQVYRVLGAVFLRSTARCLRAAGGNLRRSSWNPGATGGAVVAFGRTGRPHRCGDLERAGHRRSGLGADPRVLEQSHPLSGDRARPSQQEHRHVSARDDSHLRRAPVHSAARPVPATVGAAPEVWGSRTAPSPVLRAAHS